MAGIEEASSLMCFMKKSLIILAIFDLPNFVFINLRVQVSVGIFLPNPNDTFSKQAFVLLRLFFHVLARCAPAVCAKL